MNKEAGEGINNEWTDERINEEEENEGKNKRANRYMYRVKPNIIVPYGAIHQNSQETSMSHAAFEEHSC